MIWPPTQRLPRKKLSMQLSSEQRRRRQYIRQATLSTAASEERYIQEYIQQATFSIAASEGVLHPKRYPHLLHRPIIRNRSTIPCPDPCSQKTHPLQTSGAPATSLGYRSVVMCQPHQLKCHHPSISRLQRQRSSPAPPRLRHGRYMAMK